METTGVPYTPSQNLSCNKTKPRSCMSVLSTDLFNSSYALLM